MIKYTLCLTGLLLMVSAMAQVDQDKVRNFTKKFALENDLTEEEVGKMLQNATFQSSIIEKMERPAEAMPWHRYRKIFMTDERIAAGVGFWEQNDAVLKEVSENTGVPEEIIVGILGVETYYGQRKGTYKVLDALYTLAFGYPKRSNFFTSELDHFLVLSKEERLEPTQVTGSYAGAIGYCQFMPSSYRAYAKSYDQQGNRDLVNSVEDAIASVANYLKVHRWKRGEPLAEKAWTTKDFKALEKQSVRPQYTVSYYRKQGYEPVNNLSADQKASLLEFELEAGSEYWFTMENFYVITRYNHSPLYALAVYQLAEAVKEKRESERSN